MKPSLPIYENLPSCLKEKVWSEGEKKFGEEIKKEQNKTEDLLKNGLSFDELKKKFGGNINTDELKSTITNAESTV